MQANQLSFVMLSAAILAGAMSLSSESAHADIDTAAPAVRVTSVRVVGMQPHDPSPLIAKLESRAGSLYAPPKVAADVRALYATGLFDDVRAEWQPDPIDDAAGVLEFVVLTKPRLGQVTFSGNRKLSDKKSAKLAALSPGRPVSAADVAGAARRIEAQLHDKGYALATVTPTIAVRDDSDRRVVDVSFTVDEQRAVHVSKVVFRGNRNVSDRQLAKLVRPGRRWIPWKRHKRLLVDAELHNIHRTIALFYMNRGYAAAHIAAPTVEFTDDKRTATVVVRVSEGRKYRVGSARVKGSPSAVAAKTAAAASEIKTGSMYAYRDVARAAAAVATTVRDAGYAMATVTPEVVPGTGGRVDITFHVRAGDRRRIGAVIIRGNKYTVDKVLRQELHIAEGDVYSDGALVNSRRALARLAFVESVDIDLRDGAAPDLVDVVIDIKERNTRAFMVGAGYSSAAGPIGTARVGTTNLFGRGQALQLSGQLSPERHLVDLRFSEPRLFGTQTSASLSLYNSRRSWLGHTRRATGGAITLGRPLSEHTRGYLTYRLEDVGLETIAGDSIAAAQTGGGNEVAPLLRGGITSSIRAAVIRDTRDNLLAPKRGTAMGAYTEVAARALGSQNRFHKAGAWIRHHRPLLGPVQLNLRAALDYVGSRDGVPLSERLQSGGLGDVRGFAPGALGPRINLAAIDPSAGQGDISLGGNVRMVWNSELEFPLSNYLGLSGVVFFDAGNTFNTESSYCGLSPHACPTAGGMLGGLRASVGVGIRWMSPIGPLRFEWGFPLAREPGEDRSRFHFGIGFTF